MKKLITVLVLSLGALYGKVMVDEKDLTPEQLAKVKTKQTMETTSEYVKWGHEIGVAANETLTALTDNTAKFAKTDVGKWAMFLVTWKIMAKDVLAAGNKVIGYLIGIPFFIIGLLTCLLVLSAHVHAAPRHHRKGARALDLAVEEVCDLRSEYPTRKSRPRRLGRHPRHCWGAGHRHRHVHHLQLTAALAKTTSILDVSENAAKIISTAAFYFFNRTEGFAQLKISQEVRTYFTRIPKTPDSVGGVFMKQVKRKMTGIARASNVRRRSHSRWAPPRRISLLRNPVPVRFPLPTKRTKPKNLRGIGDFLCA